MNTVQTRMFRTLVHTVGRLSDGVRLACDHGLTAGRTLDYVYRNEPAGIGPLGRLLDRVYLSNRAWRAVRIRRRQLESFLRPAIRDRLDADGEAFILDVAAGPAGYLREVLAGLDRRRVEAICWDIDDRILLEGQTRACEAGLSNVLYDSGDALDPACFSLLPWAPNVVISSGLYDWMPDDEDVRESMRLIHDALRPGGRFLFTVQSGHRELTTANGLFPHFDGEPLRMKNRPAPLVHAWAKRAGFTIARTASDHWGYYTVTAAVRP